MSPLGLSGLFYLLAFVGGPIFFWFNPNFGQESPRILPFDHGALATATGLCLIAWVGLAVGYIVRPLSLFRIPPLRLEGWADPSVFMLVLLYGGGWLARLARLSRGEYFHGNVPIATIPTTGSSTGQLLLILAILPSVVIAYVGVIGTHRAAKSWLWVYRIGLGLEVLYYLPSGGRSFVVTIAVLALVVRFYAKGRLPIRMIVVTVLLLLFVLFPLVHLYRGAGREAGFTVNAAGNLQQSATTFAGQGLQQTLLYGVGSTFSRFSDIFVPAALIYRGRRAYPIDEGETILWSVTNLVPKAVWPNKPNTGTFAGSFAYSIGLVASKRTSVSTTQPGELYLNFGTLGVLIGMFFVGSVYREFGEWLRERRHQPMVLALYAASAYGMIGSHETIIAQGMTGLLRTAIVLALILWAAQLLAPHRYRSPALSQAL